MGPQKRFYVSHFLGKNAKMGTHIHFYPGGFGGHEEGGHVGPQKVDHCLYIPALYGAGRVPRQGQRTRQDDNCAM